MFEKYYIYVMHITVKDATTYEGKDDWKSDEPMEEAKHADHEENLPKCRTFLSLFLPF